MMVNYIEMLDRIKESIFTGDHSGLYMLACAVACISACVSLLWWYNKMLNDPFGRLDMRAIIRTLAILVVVCNFYQFVLLPFDYMVSAVTRGITSYVDSDESGMLGQINAMYSEVEKEDMENSLTGQFKEEIDKETVDASEEGLSYGTNPVMESQADNAVTKTEKEGFWSRLWSTIKMSATFIVGTPSQNTANILSWVISLFVKLVQYILLAVSSIYLIVLGLTGPFTFALALIPGNLGNISNWVARYIQISFWIPMSALMDFVNFKMKDALLEYFWSTLATGKFLMPMHLIVLDVVTIICLLGVPSMCSWIMVSSGASDVNRSIASTAAKAFMFIK